MKNLGREDAFLGRAATMLREQVAGRPEYRHASMGWGRLDYEGIVQLEDGRVTAYIPGTKTVDPTVKPVDCYNLIRRGEDMAAAVRRVFDDEPCAA